MRSPEDKIPADEVLKKVGELTQATEDLNASSQECAAEPEEVGTWLTSIGKAIIAIFR